MGKFKGYAVAVSLALAGCGSGPAANGSNAVAQADAVRERQIPCTVQAHGISEVEFIWDPARKDHLLLDVNPRVWKWIGLPIASGVDLPWLAYSEAIGQPVRAGEPRDGMRWIYERDYALLAQSRPLFPATGEVVNAVWDPDDPGPFAQLILNEGPAGKYYCAC